MGGNMPKPPAPPLPPAPTDAGANVQANAQAEKKRQGFQSTILTGNKLGTTNANSAPVKTLLGS